MFQLFLQATEPTDKVPATCYDYSWDLTLSNAAAVLSAVVNKHTEWELTEPKPVILRYKTDTDPELVQFVLNRIQQAVRQLGFQDKILVPELTELTELQTEVIKATRIEYPSVASPKLSNLQQPKLPSWKKAEEAE